jgi:hypothetical protein
LLNSEDLNGDILIGYFGTRVGWPRLPKFMQFFLPDMFRRVTAFDLPLGEIESDKRTLKYKSRKQFKRFIKRLAIYFNAYKPEKEISELLGEIDIYFRTASLKFEKIYILQHHQYEDGRLAFETRIYNNYYYEILDFARSQNKENIEVIELPKEFLKAGNYLGDNLHLSMHGHVALSKIFIEKIYNDDTIQS